MGTGLARTDNIGTPPIASPMCRLKEGLQRQTTIDVGHQRPETQGYRVSPPPTSLTIASSPLTVNREGPHRLHSETVPAITGGLKLADV